MNEGSRNTRFFHLLAKIRGNKNSIDQISFNGQNLVNPHAIKDAASEFFSSTFKVGPTTIDEHCFYCNQPKITSLQNNQLVVTPDFDEVKKTVFSLGNLSARGPDGFSGCFYSSCGDIVSHDVVTAVQNFFTFGKLLKASTNFLLALIPKSPTPSCFQDFRPISLLNFSFKIITKIMASRLSPIISYIISLHQATFITNRSIHKHIALAHELTQKLKQKFSGGSFFMKIDISKAFDMLD